MAEGAPRVFVNIGQEGRVNEFGRWRSADSKPRRSSGWSARSPVRRGRRLRIKVGGSIAMEVRTEAVGRKEAMMADAGIRGQAGDKHGRGG